MPEYDECSTSSAISLRPRCSRTNVQWTTENWVLAVNNDPPYFQVKSKLNNRATQGYIIWAELWRGVSISLDDLRARMCRTYHQIDPVVH